MTPEAFLDFSHTLPDGMLMVSEAGVVLAANPAFIESLHCRPEALVGQPLRNLVFDPEDELQHYLARCAGSREALAGEIRWQMAGGAVVETCCWGSALASIHDSGHRSILIRCEKKNASARHLFDLNKELDALRLRHDELLDQRSRLEGDMAERTKRLVERESFLRAILETAADGIVTIDKDSMIRSFNRAAEIIFGYRAEEVIGTHLERLMPEKFRDLHNSHLNRYVKTGQKSILGAGPVAVEALRKGGEVFPIEVSISELSQGDNRYFIGILRDITQRQQVEDALRQSELRFRTLIETITSGIQENDCEGKITFSNQGHSNILGYGPNELVGRYIWDMLESDEERERLKAYLAYLLKEQPEPTPFFSRNVRKDGKVIDIQVDWNYKRDSEGDVVGFICVITDITARKQVEKELQQARDVALQSVRMKSQFLANMSHEIRTPMNGVLGMLGLVKSTPLSQEQQEYIDNAYRSAESLLGIINDILDFSKFEAGKLKLEEIDFDLCSVVEEVADLLAEQAQKKGVELICEIDPAVPCRVNGDPGRLRQVLNNLLGNAIKFTPSGEVVVKVSMVQQVGYPALALLRFDVIDTGIGIAPQAVDSIFESFSQADGSTTRRYGGTGLGLAISRQLVGYMGGKIGVDSVPDKGSRFWFTAKFRSLACESEAPSSLRGARVLLIGGNETLRVVLARMLSHWGASCQEMAWDEAMLDDVDATPSVQAIVVDMGEELLSVVQAIRRRSRFKETPIVALGPIGHAVDDSEIAVSVTKPVRRAQLAAALSKVILNPSDDVKAAEPVREQSRASVLSGRVLVVEDNIVNQKVMAAMLRREGCHVDIANHGKEAVEALAEADYDMVFMDCQMPVMDGYEATQIIRAGESDGGQHLPIIAVTANAMEGDRERCLIMGMDDYISKPVSADGLRAILQKWLSACDDDRSDNVAILDVSMLEELKELLGVSWQEFVQSYIDDSKHYIEQLGLAVERGDQSRIATVAHPLKSSSAQIGATHLVSLCKELEEQARTETLQEPGRLLELIVEAYGKVCRELSLFE